MISLQKTTSLNNINKKLITHELLIQRTKNEKIQHQVYFNITIH